MAFEDIPPVPSADELLQQALKEGRSKARKVTRKKSDDSLSYLRKKERERFIAIVSALSTRLTQLPTRFPSIDTLTEFYRELLRNDVDLDDLREKLARMQNTRRALLGIKSRLRGRLDGAQSANEIKNATGAFIGRISGAVERLADDLLWLEDVRKKLRTYPKLKEMPTVCIAGFPNVGKTTLLTKITGSSAEINEYAFTTKSLNLGYARVGKVKVQFIDTPGTLNRDKMNAIERQAHLALKYAADVIVYVFDLTESYPLADQKALRDVMDEYTAPVINFFSKQDLLTENQIDSFEDGAIRDAEQLLQAISKAL